MTIEKPVMEMTEAEYDAYVASEIRKQIAGADKHRKKRNE
jgi:hypothetical protein